MDWDSDLEEIEFEIRPIPKKVIKSLLQQRPASCGILAFHKGTEESMFLFLEQHREVLAGHPLKILNAIDWFCYSRHWMMHVGEKKSPTIQNGIKRHQKSDKPFICLELGSYCGYSALVIGSQLRHEKGDVLFCLELNPSCVAWTTRLVSFAGLAQTVKVICGSLCHLEEDGRTINSSNNHLILSQISNLIWNHISHHQQNIQNYFQTNQTNDTLLSTTNDIDAQSIDQGLISLLFLDHEKQLYLPDLLSIEAYRFTPLTPSPLIPPQPEQSPINLTPSFPILSHSLSFPLLGSGSLVIADNILSFSCPLTDLLYHLNLPDSEDLIISSSSSSSFNPTPSNLVGSIPILTPHHHHHPILYETILHRGYIEYCDEGIDSDKDGKEEEEEEEEKKNMEDNQSFGDNDRDEIGQRKKSTGLRDEEKGLGVRINTKFSMNDGITVSIRF